MSVLEQNLLKEFECSICTEYMHPPIRLCETGHSCCDGCHAKQGKCPKCLHGFLPSARNVSLENIHAKMTFTCRYKCNGCKFPANGVNIKHHETVCEFRTVRCPLNMVNICETTVLKYNILEHCKRMHGNNTLEFAIGENISCDMACDFTHFARSLLYVNQEKNLYFIHVWDVNVEAKTIKMCVFSMTNRKYATNYSFKVKIRNANNLTQKLSFTGQCPKLSFNDDCDLLETFKEQFVTVNLGFVKQYCITDKLHFQLRILKDN